MHWTIRSSPGKSLHVVFEVVGMCVGDEIDEDGAIFILLLEGISSSALVASLRMSDIICCSSPIFCIFVYTPSTLLCPVRDIISCSSTPF